MCADDILFRHLGREVPVFARPLVTSLLVRLGADKRSYAN